MTPRLLRALALAFVLFPSALAAQTSAPPAWFSSQMHGLVVDGYYQRESAAAETLGAVIAAEYPKLKSDWPRIEQVIRSWNPQLRGSSVAAGTSLRLPVLGTATAGEVVSLEVRGAGAQIGIVQESSGSLSAQDANGLRRSLQVGDALWTGDRISTGTASRARLRLMDGGQILLRADSAVELKALSFDGGDDNAGTGILRLIKGSVRVISGLISKNPKSTVKLETQMAVIGVRGTDYSARLCEPEGCELGAAPAVAGVYLGLLDGAVDMRNDGGGADLAPGDVYRARSMQAAPEPAPEAAALVFGEAELKLLPAKAAPPVDAPAPQRPCRLGGACGPRGR